MESETGVEMKEQEMEEEEEASAAWGGDLGTETSSASVVINNVAETVLIDGEKCMPTAVYLQFSPGSQQPTEVAALKDENERFEKDPPEIYLVGKEAVAKATRKCGLLTHFKSLIGRDFHDRYVQEFAKRAPFKIVEAANHEVEIEVEGRRFTPQFLESLVLEHMKLAVKVHVESKTGLTNVRVDEMALGIPANFNFRQRKRTMQATELAGLTCHRLLNEPTAVAYAHLITVKNDEMVYRLILDLGGGTFDVTFIYIDKEVNEMIVINKDGDNDLGGVHLTRALADHAIKKYGRDAKTLTADDRHKIFAAAERAKQGFSDVAVEKQEIRCQLQVGKSFKLFKVEITRAEFRRILTPLLERLKEPIIKLINQNPTEWGKLQCAFPMGCATMLPEVQEFFRQYSRKELRAEVDLETGVSTGVALYVGPESSTHFGNDTNAHPEPRDTTAFDLGVEQGEGRMGVMIERNTPIPVSKVVKKEFYFGQNEDGTFKNDITIKILEGDSKLTYQNALLGKLKLHRTPKPVDLQGDVAPIDEKEQHRVEVTFAIDINSVITVSATAVSTGETKETQFDGAVDEEQEVVAVMSEKVRDGESSKAGHGEKSQSSTKRDTSMKYVRRAAGLQRDIMRLDRGSTERDYKKLERESLSRADELRKHASEAEAKGDVTLAKKLYLQAGFVYSCLPDGTTAQKATHSAEEMLGKADLMVRREKAGIRQVVKHIAIDIDEGSFNWDYARVFDKMLTDKDFKVVILQDPYIHDLHQIRKLNLLLDLFVNRIRSFDTFILITHRDRRAHSKQENYFNQLRQHSAECTDKDHRDGISFEVLYDANIHDRFLLTDSCWKGKLGPGIDIYRDFMPFIGIGAMNPKNLRTRVCSIDLFKLLDGTEFNQLLDKVAKKRDNPDPEGPPPAKQGRFQPSTTNMPQYGSNFEPFAFQQPNMGGMPGSSSSHRDGESELGHLAGYGGNVSAAPAIRYAGRVEEGAQTLQPHVNDDAYDPDDNYYDDDDEEDADGFGSE